MRIGENDRLGRLPEVLKVFTFSLFSYKDYSLALRICKYIKNIRERSFQLKHIPRFIKVPEDCSFNLAVQKINAELSTIIVGKGVHFFTNYWINKCMNIIGDPDVPTSDIIVKGGFSIHKSDGSHFENITVQTVDNWNSVGMFTYSSVTLKNVVIEHCYGCGLIAFKNSSVTCTNVVVRHCGGSGIYVDTGSIVTLRGTETSINNNCKKGDHYHYGLRAGGYSASIRLVHPLTRETTSIDNKDDKNYNDTGFIVNVEAE